MSTVTEISAYVAAELEQLRNSDNAQQMAAYLKTDQPFYGVKKPERVPVYRGAKAICPKLSHPQYLAVVRRLFGKKHREEQYVALWLAENHRAHICLASMDLYEHLIRKGQWWDLVDGVATNLVGKVWLKQRRNGDADVDAQMDDWNEDEDLWIRRTSIIAQLKHKTETDHKRLFRYCRRRANEKDFFIRKAIGWALRDYGKHDPARVVDFLNKHHHKLSPLSLREASRVLVKEGRMKPLA